MVSIIIINYYQKDLLFECVRSINACLLSYPFEVIIINNSPEESLSEIGAAFTDVKIFENKNRGYSNANNFGSEKAAGEYLLFLNADTIIKNDFLEELTKRFASKDFGAAGLKLLNPDGSFQLSFWKENTFFNELENKRAEASFAKKNNEYISGIESRYKDVKEVDWVTGAALFIRKDVFQDIGGFDEDYFLFYEDADLCKRLRLNGYKIYFYPFSEIIHLKGENVNRSFKSNSYYFSKESELLYYKKHNSFSDRFLLRVYLFIKFLFLSLITFKRINLKILGRVLSFK